MIVDPDFIDHWRTRMLVDALGGDEFAPFYLLRLWGHCQTRKGDRFEIPAAGLKALCKATCDAALLEASLIEAGYIARDGQTVVVLKWAEKNSSLLAAWENGARGGRPTKKPNQNPRVKEEEPKQNPAVTQPKPTANPDETDKRREEKSREEKTEVSGPAPRAAPPPPPDFDGKNAEALNGKSIVAIAVGWELPEQWGVDAEALGWRPGQVLKESEKFRQYWTAGRGQGTRRSVKGWRQAWSNWLEKAAKDQR